MDTLLEDRLKFATVSGIWTTKPSMILRADQMYPCISVITTKSYQVNPNPGNREPIITDQGNGSFGNAVGLRNPGMEKGYSDLKALLEKEDIDSVLNVSVSGGSIDEFKQLITRFYDIADMIELNFSCPHASPGYGSSIGTYPEVVKEYMSALRKHADSIGEDIILFPKLTPNVNDIGEIARIAVESGADGLVGMNTFGPEEYIEPHSGKPILFNPNGHKGGKSGEWITEEALKKVEEIRLAVGHSVPIIGMGGVTYAEDAVRMNNVADVVGIGSVISRIRQKERDKFIINLYSDVQSGTDSSRKMISQEPMGNYTPYRIYHIDQRGDDFRVMTLEGNLEYKASQFGFIWMPEVGEKPFAFAWDDPLRFVIKKKPHEPNENPKLSKGLVTHALFQAEEGDTIYVRSLCGDEPDITDKNRAYIVAGGTGIAVVPMLARKLDSEGKELSVYYGVTDESHKVFEEEISMHGRYFQIVDNPNTPGRAIDMLSQHHMGEDMSDTAFYNIGPVPFMEKAIMHQTRMGISPEDIYLSLETRNMCGMRMCGECECGGKLTCDEGTFFTLEYMMNKGIEMRDLEK